MPRGSDIQNDNDPFFFVSAIGPLHTVILNRYCVYRPQYLLMAKDFRGSQNDPLYYNDLAAAWSLLLASPTPLFLIYNCDPEAGCSRQHKHMHAFPRPGTEANPDLPLFPDRPVHILPAQVLSYFAQKCGGRRTYGTRSDSSLSKVVPIDK